MSDVGNKVDNLKDFRATSTSVVSASISSPKAPMAPPNSTLTSSSRETEPSKKCRCEQEAYYSLNTIMSANFKK